MAKQINQYTKIRTSGTVTTDDLIDLDSTDDGGASYESAKITIANLLSYIGANGVNLYNQNGSLLGDRDVTASTYYTRWTGGNVEVSMADEISDYAFIVRDVSLTEKAKLGYDQSTLSGELSLANIGGEYLSANDGIFQVNTNILHVDTNNIGIGTNTPNASSIVEFSSTTKGVRYTPMTVDQAGAITPIEGLVLFVSDTDATFPSIGLYCYENGAWNKL